MTQRSTGNTAVIKVAFKGLDQNAIDLLRQFGVNHDYPARTVLCREGDPAETFFVITEGRVVVTKQVEGQPQGEEFVMGMLGEGSYFGELALLDSGVRSATVTTMLPTKVLEITREQFETVFQASPAMARNLLATMIGTIRETDRRAIADLEERNAQLARAYADLEAAQADRIARAALQAQLDVAGVAQRSLLPTFLPQVTGASFAARFEPAAEVGGDFYDVRPLPDGRVAVLIADVSDKGAHAALFMAVARTLFLTEGQHYTEPARVALAVHQGLLEATEYEMFVTAIYGVFDPTDRSFRYVRAGHEEPLLIRSDGTAQWLGGGGRFLGFIDSPPPRLSEEQISLYPGDCLVLFSDGVTDMRSPEGESFGREGLMQLVRSLRMYPAERIANSVYNTVSAHRGGMNAFDDFTLLLLQIA